MVVPPAQHVQVVDVINVRANEGRDLLEVADDGKAERYHTDSLTITFNSFQYCSLGTTKVSNLATQNLNWIMRSLSSCVMMRACWARDAGDARLS